MTERLARACSSHPWRTIAGWLGRWSWDLPSGLEWLPRVEIEGQHAAPSGRVS
jgi:hypothetical protein